MMKIPSMLIVLMAVAPVVLADDAIDSALRGTDVSTDVEGQEDSWFGLRKLIGLCGVCGVPLPCGVDGACAQGRIASWSETECSRRSSDAMDVSSI